MPPSRTAPTGPARPRIAPSHAYAEFKGTPLWRVLDGAVADLEKNHDLALKTSRQVVVGYFCEKLSRSKAAPALIIERRSKTPRTRSGNVSTTVHKPKTRS